MLKNWTFGQKLGAGFAVVVAMTIAISVVSIFSLRDVIAAKDRVIDFYGENILGAQKPLFFNFKNLNFYFFFEKL